MLVGLVAPPFSNGLSDSRIKRPSVAVSDTTVTSKQSPQTRPLERPASSPGRRGISKRRPRHRHMGFVHPGFCTLSSVVLAPLLVSSSGYTISVRMMSSWPNLTRTSSSAAEKKTSSFFMVLFEKFLRRPRDTKSSQTVVTCDTWGFSDNSVL